MGQTTPPRKKEHVTETATTTTRKPSTGPGRDLRRVTSGRMTNSNESLSGEVRAARCSLLGPKAQIRIGAWKVRTMYEMPRSELTMLTMKEPWANTAVAL